MNQLVFDEIKENDRQVDVETTITSLNLAGFLLTRIAKESDEGDRGMAIDGLGAVISAMPYLSLMRSTIDAMKGPRWDDSCA